MISGDAPWHLHARAMAVSLAVLGFAVGLVWLGNAAKAGLPERIVVREVVLTLPPPPPPPPPTQATQTQSPMAMTVQGTGSSIPNISLTTPPLQLTRPEAPSVNMQAPQWQSLEVDWQAFSLNELDGLPALMTPLKVQLPKSLSRKGINQVLVKLEIVVDEKGRVELVQVVENPHPELQPQIEQMVRQARFSAPQKGNAPVRARFIWPVEIKA